jgi:Rrf2 family protein
MLLSQTSEYALRAMAHLAREPEGAWVSGRDLAQATRVPPAYVGKVMRQLVLAGLVAGKSGKAGGFRVARPPASIRFIDVLDALDAVPDDERCAFGLDRCDPDSPCHLHDNWAQLRNFFLQWAENTTFADVGPDGQIPELPKA